MSLKLSKERKAEALSYLRIHNVDPEALHNVIQRTVSDLRWAYTPSSPNILAGLVYEEVVKELYRCFSDDSLQDIEI